MMGTEFRSFGRWRVQGPAGMGGGGDFRIGEKAHLGKGTAQLRTASRDQAGCSCGGRVGGKGLPTRQKQKPSRPEGLYLYPGQL